MKKSATGLVVVLTLCGSLGVDAQSYIYPAKGQSPEQQQKDEAECYTWAVGQSGYDPAKPAPVPTATAATPPPPPSGGRLRGAAGGAVVGEITDNDVGDAALAGAVIGGMHQRQERRKAASASQQQAATQQKQASQAQAAGQAEYQKARAACLEGRGYTVK